MESHWLEWAAAAVAGSLAGSVFACIPALHIYNVFGAVLAFSGFALAPGWPPDLLLPVLAGLLAGWVINTSIPSILLGAADESAVFTVLPGQLYLRRGEGIQAVMLTAAGSLGGLVLLSLCVVPFLPICLPSVRGVLRLHSHWILWCVIAYLVLSEWPKGGLRGQGGWGKLRDGWRTTGAGLVTFGLAGMLGLIVFFRSPVKLDAAFQGLMPAFVGLFALPWLLLNLVSESSFPPQRAGDRLDLDLWTLARGVGVGTAGGGIAALLPGVTGGVGAFLAGQAAGERDDRAFLVCQGAARTVYYLGAFLLGFASCGGMTRGGAAWLVRALPVEGGAHVYVPVVAALALGGGMGFLVCRPLSRAMAALTHCVGCRGLSAVSLGVAVMLVLGITGWAGVLIAAAATGIGLLPVLYGSRRMNCLAVILVPLACQLSGIGPAVASALGLDP